MSLFYVTFFNQNFFIITFSRIPSVYVGIMEKKICTDIKTHNIRIRTSRRRVIKYFIYLNVRLFAFNVSLKDYKYFNTLMCRSPHI
jgi:hypothetical protein